MTVVDIIFSEYFFFPPPLLECRALLVTAINTSKAICHNKQNFPHS